MCPPNGIAESDGRADGRSRIYIFIKTPTARPRRDAPWAPLKACRGVIKHSGKKKPPFLQITQTHFRTLISFFPTPILPPLSPRRFSDRLAARRRRLVSRASFPLASLPLAWTLIKNTIFSFHLIRQPRFRASLSPPFPRSRSVRFFVCLADL
jgi:hypothetical protein